MTSLVAVAPVLAIWWLESDGVLRSPLLAIAASAALSLALYHVAARVWQRRAGAGDVLFGDLLLWGWVRRGWQQRRVASAVALLGVAPDGNWRAPADLALGQRVKALEQLACDLELRDPYTHGHSRRVARYAAMIAERMGIGGDELARIRTAAAVHDVGKIQTPLDVLCKPRKLEPGEFGNRGGLGKPGYAVVGRVDLQNDRSVVGPGVGVVGAPGVWSCRLKDVAEILQHHRSAGVRPLRPKAEADRLCFPGRSREQKKNISQFRPLRVPPANLPA